MGAELRHDRGAPPGLARVQADIQRALDAGEVRLPKPRSGTTRPRRAGRGSVEANTVKPLSKNPGAIQCPLRQRDQVYSSRPGFSTYVHPLSCQAGCQRLESSARRISAILPRSSCNRTRSPLIRTKCLMTTTAPARKSKFMMKPCQPPLRVRTQNRVHASGGILLESRGHVRVQVQRDAYRAVSQHLSNDFGIHALLHHLGRGRMPQIMKSEIRKSGLQEEALIGDVESLGFHRGALLGGEDESLLSWDDLPRPFLARSEPLCELSRPYCRLRASEARTLAPGRVPCQRRHASRSAPGAVLSSTRKAQLSAPKHIVIVVAPCVSRDQDFGRITNFRRVRPVGVVDRSEHDDTLCRGHDSAHIRATVRRASEIVHLPRMAPLQPPTERGKLRENASTGATPQRSKPSSRAFVLITSEAREEDTKLE